MTRVVFMGTPEFALPALNTLIETKDVVGVITQPDRPAGRGQQLRPSPVKVAAETAGIPLYQPLSLKLPESAGPIREWAPEIIVVAAYGEILRSHILELPPAGCLNVHASLLPRWRGASPIQHAILAGDEQTGVSLMQMDVGLDTGPVYAQRRLAIQPAETAETLHDRLAAASGEILKDRLDGILSGEIKAVPQNDELATYAPMIRKEDGRIDWEQSAEQIERHVRAMTPWPSAYTRWKGKRLKVLRVRPFFQEAAGRSLPPGPPGRIVGAGDAVVVLTGDGELQLVEIQLAGRQPMSASNFIHGHSEFVGSQLE